MHTGTGIVGAPSGLGKGQQHIRRLDVAGKERGCRHARLAPQKEWTHRAPQGGGDVFEGRRFRCGLQAKGDEQGILCDASCRAQQLRGFVTAAAFDGDLGGLFGADLKCQGAAAAAGLPEPERFHAFLSTGTVDVVVTSGFTGNIALKTAEGTARLIGHYIRSAMARSFLSRIGYVFSKSGFNVLRQKLDPRAVNGGVFLGLNGVVVKSHGGTDGLGFASAIDLAVEMGGSDFVQRVADAMAHLPASGAALDGSKPEPVTETAAAPEAATS